MKREAHVRECLLCRTNTQVLQEAGASCLSVEFQDHSHLKSGDAQVSGIKPVILRHSPYALNDILVPDVGMWGQ